MRNQTALDQRDLQEKLRILCEMLKSHAPLLIAYSGGVDSTFLLNEAARELGNNALGLIADSPSLPRLALAEALQNASAFGAKVEVIRTNELSDPRYSSNPLNRCYFCKFELFRKMEDLAVERGFAALAYGENADDALQFRPGATAAEEFRVIAPLRSAGLTKIDIRSISRERGLPTADKPAQPCLSSRIPHGTEVTPTALLMIENAEEFMRSSGFSVFRVRYIAGSEREEPGAKLQVDKEEMGKLRALQPKICAGLRAIGFGEIRIDPDGYRAPPTVRQR